MPHTYVISSIFLSQWFSIGTVSLPSKEFLQFYISMKNSGRSRSLTFWLLVRILSSSKLWDMILQLDHTACPVFFPMSWA